MSSSIFNTSVPANFCSPASIPYPELYGAEFLSLNTQLITNYSTTIRSGLYTNHGAVEVTNVNICNVTVTYTHPGQNDSINVQVWLPQDTWNGRLQHIGGAGWQAGLHYAGLQGMMGAVGEGYASLGTDAGLGSDVTPENWALISPGNVNRYLLENLISTSLNDASIIGKSIVKSYYGQDSAFSYFSGCSQGGRQGMMLAQHYPKAYDGIAASAPAINWSELFVGDYFPTLLMNVLGQAPAPCEINALTAAAILACDRKDGIVDGVIADPAACDFDPQTLLGTTINCTDTGSNRQISPIAIQLAEAAWSGPETSDGTNFWYGIEKGSDLVISAITRTQGVVSTTCATNGTCVPSGFDLVAPWLKLFVLKNASADLSTLTREEFDSLYLSSKQEYGFFDTNEPDLTEFRDNGGKLISYHGLSDLIITPRSTQHYYDSVTAVDENVHDYYRLFLAPGLDHCFGGPGAYPAGTFDAMRNWVENGIAPDSLSAESLADGSGNTFKRTLCPYPKKQYYNGTGDSSTGEGFYCM